MSKIAEFALSEWKRYLNKAGVNDASLDFVVNCDAFDKKEFRLINTEFDSKFDDAFKVEIDGAKGKITATNERSFLLAVYECLRRLGFCFISPVEQHDYIPKDLIKEKISLSFIHYANYRHRGVAPCAPREIESLKDYIKWLVKLGMNSFFSEGWTGHLSYRSWYMHEENEFIKQEKEYTIEESLSFDKECVDLAKTFGLIVHAMGHGWNVATISNNVYNDMYPDENTVIDYSKIALVNRQRKLPNNIIRCANLCLSNKSVIEKLVELVISYVKDNPKVDIVHFWLGDSLNNVCECEECKKTTISDQYVELLKEIDKRLIQHASAVKIVFLLYQDTLWIPLKNKLNSNRFILQFSPITRDYAISYKSVEKSKSENIQKYKRNALEIPVEPKDFLAYLSEWQKIFKGDCFAFDYQNYYASRYDISNERASKIVHEDVVAYRNYGINGLISCQFYRNGFPHEFSTYAMARTLFDGQFDYEKEKKEYYLKSFGSFAPCVKQYFSLVERVISLEFLQWYGENDAIRKQKNTPNISNDEIFLLGKTTKEFERKVKEWKSENSAEEIRKRVLIYYIAVVFAYEDIIKLKNSGASNQELLDRREVLRVYLSKNEEFLLPYCSIDHVLQVVYWLCVN